MTVGALEYIVNDIVIELAIVPSTCRVCSAEIDGTKYSKGGIVLVGFKDDMPGFGEITDIITSEVQECHLSASTNIFMHF